MNDPTPDPLATRQLDELLGNQVRELDRAVTTNQRWVLSLALGNGAALAALAASMIEGKSEALAALLMPSCWMFALGLILAGAVNPLTAKRHHLAYGVWKNWTVSFRKGEQLVEPSETITRAEDRLYKAELALEWGSAGSFVLGLLYPLSVLCVRYLTSGEGFFRP